MDQESHNAAKTRLPLTVRVGRQPVMVLGLNATEFLLVMLIGFGSMLLLTLFGWLVFGKVHYGMAFGSVCGLLVAYIARELFVAYKRQTPDGYFQQILFKNMTRLFGRELLITHNGTWDVLRKFK